MNCTECGQQTDVSAPGAAQLQEASPGHDVDVWPDHPRQRDNHPAASAGAIFSRRVDVAASARIRALFVFARGVKSYRQAAKPAGSFTAREHAFRATPGPELAN